MLEKRRVKLTESKSMTSNLTSSISKLSAIRDIVGFEYEQLGKELRMVILSDFIRKDFFISGTENNVPLTKMGIVPIFEKLRRENEHNMKIGILTGSLIVVPTTAMTAIDERAALKGLAEIRFSPVSYDDNYQIISLTEQVRHNVVQIITDIFQQGEIEVLIGTKSLLGEGWDAPAINALVLATFVGSFVLSNQMRGRTIRTQKGNPEKTGNVWHLVCIDPTSEGGGSDLELLQRRFKGFVGISVSGPNAIENGTQRLELPAKLNNEHHIRETNQKTLEHAANRQLLKERWRNALHDGSSLMEEIRVPFTGPKNYQETTSMYLNRTLASLIATLTSGIGAYFFGALESLGRSRIKSMRELAIWLIVFASAGAIFFARMTFKALRLYLRYRDISKDVKQIGQALVHTLVNAEIIHTPASSLKVITMKDTSGAVYCHLEGGTTFEKSAFIQALHELVSPIDNPRYVIIRKSTFLMFRQKDYHAVPEPIGRTKVLATYFEKQWGQHVGHCELVYTRTLEGRKNLLKYRLKSLSAQLSEQPEHVSKWR